jgi:NADP-dependent 3-hydroxy acid dehydrogenase YdfG
MDLFVVYGSETSLLSELYNRPDSVFLRFYNETRLEGDSNSYFANSFVELESHLDMILKKFDITRIVFIGAGFLSQTKLYFQATESEIEAQIETNIRNYLKFTSILLPKMIQKKAGHFIYLSSFRSQTTCRGVTLYAASKSFGETFFEVLGKENGRFGVFSTSIRMGYFDGRMTNNLPADRQKSIKSAIGVDSLGSAADLFSTIEYILGNKYTNGGVVDLTGGINHIE